jgi:hypothetical protein
MDKNLNEQPATANVLGQEADSKTHGNLASLHANLPVAKIDWTKANNQPEMKMAAAPIHADKVIAQPIAAQVADSQFVGNLKPEPAAPPRTHPVITDSIQVLVKRMKLRHEAMKSLDRQYGASLIEQGLDLIKTKKIVGFGHWLPWLAAHEDDLGFKRSWAEVCMGMAKWRDGPGKDMQIGDLSVMEILDLAGLYKRASSVAGAVPPTERGLEAVNLLAERFPDLQSDLTAAARKNPDISYSELENLAGEIVKKKQADLQNNAGRNASESKIPPKDADYQQAAAEVQPIIGSDDRAVKAELTENTLELRFPWKPASTAHVANALHDLPANKSGNVFRIMSTCGLLIKIRNEEKPQ